MGVSEPVRGELGWHPTALIPLDRGHLGVHRVRLHGREHPNVRLPAQVDERPTGLQRLRPVGRALVAQSPQVLPVEAGELVRDVHPSVTASLHPVATRVITAGA